MKSISDILNFFKGITVFALVGESGTGKSFRAKLLAQKHGIEAIIDDGLLIKEDKILLMSDGLYKLVSNDEIKRILSNFSNIEDALKALEIKAQKAARSKNVNRDNMTVALVKIK